MSNFSTCSGKCGNGKEEEGHLLACTVGIKMRLQMLPMADPGMPSGTAPLLLNFNTTCHVFMHWLKNTGSW